MPESNHLLFDRTDAVCKQYDTQAHQPLPYEAYLFLLAHQQEADVLEKLLSTRYREEQDRLRANFRQRYVENGYVSAALIPQKVRVCAEKLPRYVALPEHAHHFIEIVCVLSGECEHIVEGCAYRQEAGSVAFVNTYARHRLRAIGDALCFTIKARSEYFAGLKLPYMLSFITPILYHCGDDPLVRELTLRLWAQNEAEPLYRPRMSELLFETLMFHIGQSYRNTMERMYASPLLDQQIIPILDYMAENFRTVTLHSAAEHFHYSEPYLSRMFREKTGGTFSQRLRDFKLAQAANLLRETDQTLNDVCDAVGYADVTQFIHIFKAKYHQTPGQYRKANRKLPAPD